MKRDIATNGYYSGIDPRVRKVLAEQAEAIEKLQKLYDLQTISDMVLEPTNDKPEMVSKARYAEKLGIHNNPHEHVYRCQDCDKTQVEVEDNDTHRTVTLRIPKGMRVGDAFNLAYLFSDSSWEEFITRSDTDLQAALDNLTNTGE